MNKLVRPLVPLLAATLLAGTATVATAQPQPAAAPQGAVSGAAPLVEGEVRKVDTESGKLTLRHGALPHLEMPAMTMVFRVADPAMLDSVQVGNKVRFAADRVGGAFTVTRLERAD